MKGLILKTIALCFVSASSFINAQVRINVPKGSEDPSASLQIGYLDRKKGVTIPQIALVSKTSYAPIRVEPKEGLMVYNSVIRDDIDKGYYYWSKIGGGHWESLGGVVRKSTIIQNINPRVLGYDATGTGGSAPATFAIGGGTASKIKCAKWELNVGGNGHTYCGYAVTKNIDFNQLYIAAKTLKAYPLTVTSNNEWNFVKENLIDDVKSAIWLGYATVRTPGNPYKYRWITGETWNNSWGNSASVQAVFAPNNPKSTVEYYGNNPFAGDYESKNPAGLCTVIAGKADNPDRQWYSTTCDLATFGSVGINQVIIEFNN